jgi:hypothetical protein
MRLEHAEMVVDFLRSGGAWPEAEFYTASTYDDAIRLFLAMSFDVAFFDYWLGSRDGLTAASRSPSSRHRHTRRGVNQSRRRRNCRSRR